MYDIRNKSIVSVVIIGILVIAGLYILTSKSKPVKKTAQYSDYFVGLVTNNCQRSQEAFDEIKKIDPNGENPLKYKPDNNSPEIIITYDDLNQYIVMCKNKQLTKEDLTRIAKALEKDLDNLDLYLKGY